MTDRRTRYPLFRHVLNAEKLGDRPDKEVDAPLTSRFAEKGDP